MPERIRMTKYRTEINRLWVTPLVTVVLEEDPPGLNKFHVFNNGDARYLGTIKIGDRLAQEGAMHALNKEACPIADVWEILERPGESEEIDPFVAEILRQIKPELEKEEPDATTLFLNEEDRISSYFHPAYQNGFSDVALPHENGLYDVTELEHFFELTGPIETRRMRRHGTGNCLVAFLGKRHVTIEQSYYLTPKAVDSIQWLMTLLGSEQEDKRFNIYNSEELKSIVLDITFREARLVRSMSGDVFTIRPAMPEE